MNVFQKSAICLLRVVGVTLTVIGAVGLVVFLLPKTPAQLRAIQPPQRWDQSAPWVLAGLVSILISRPVGRWIGRGLD
jgi:hypothetical protein